MPEEPSPREKELENEIARQNKMIRVLMDHAERNASAQSTDFSFFQRTLALEEQVLKRTAKLEAALLENQKITRALRESEEKFRGLVSQSLVSIYILEDGKFVYCNARGLEMFGYTEEELKRGISFLDLVAESDRAAVMEQFCDRMSGDVRQQEYTLHCVRKDGRLIDVELHSSRMEFGGKTALIGMSLDVTERVRAERELRALQATLQEQSTRDPLTGLYNRRYLDDSLERELTTAKRYKYPVSVIMADIDHFKEVNDRYGHQAGDEVLRDFGALLKRHIRGSDVFCRYGGEEFLLVLPQMTTELAQHRAELVRNALALAPVPFGGTRIAITASFGVATLPGHAQTRDELIAAADSALYAAKAEGRNCVKVSTAAPAIDQLQPSTPHPAYGSFSWLQDDPHTSATTDGYFKGSFHSDVSD
jgi:diguanylate cyclase (GGDEF)-like protein/PAS domain S-box-containing protein